MHVMKCYSVFIVIDLLNIQNLDTNILKVFSTNTRELNNFHSISVFQIKIHDFQSKIESKSVSQAHEIV